MIQSTLKILIAPYSTSSTILNIKSIVTRYSKSWTPSKGNLAVKESFTTFRMVVSSAHSSSTSIPFAMIESHFRRWNSSWSSESQQRNKAYSKTFPFFTVFLAVLLRWEGPDAALKRSCLFNRPQSPANELSCSIPSARLRVSLMVACGIVDERLEFPVGFEVVIEGEVKSLDASPSNSDTRPLIPSSIFTADKNRVKTKQNGHRWHVTW